jgi:hypothetical protein
MERKENLPREKSDEFALLVSRTELHRKIAPSNHYQTEIQGSNK